jgi:beta-glucosidase
MSPVIKNIQKNNFPDEFIWGVATSAFQIEGAARNDGRGESVWDRFCQQSGTIADSSNGDVACDHYHRLEEDLDLLAELGVPAYRFSISWSRVQPNGAGNWNEQGLDFYDRLIEGLSERGISGHLTLFHWDLPQALQDHGGWANRETVSRFVDYARYICQRYGNRVASIATHNEPWVVATLGHEFGNFAPGIMDVRIASQVTHHLLLSHGLAVLAMRACGKSAKLGIVLNQGPIYPATQSEVDQNKARLEDGLLIRRYMDPLFCGSYPEDVLKYLGKNGPEVLEGDMDIIATPIDFLGINYYTRSVVTADESIKKRKQEFPVTDMGWEIYPDGLKELLIRLNQDYRLPPIYITENGAAFADSLVDGQVDDPDRVNYLQTHISSMADAIRDGVNIRGYFVWSFLDNFEWAFGYTKRFGIVYVDFVNQRRIPKTSARWFRDFLVLQAKVI